MSSDVLELPHGTLAATRMSKDEVRRELAVMFYASGRRSFGKARQLAGVDHLQFRQEMAARGVTVHLEPHDIDSDMAAIEVEIYHAAVAWRRTPCWCPVALME